MNTIKCLLIDDEPPAIALLEKYISLTDQLEVIGKCYNAVKAFDVLKKTDVDLMFLDIQMPILNGIEFIKTLKRPPSIIITTAYREYALDGYDLDIIDYLLKPIPFDRFLKSIDRYRNRSGVTIDSKDRGSEEEYIYFNINRTKHKVHLSDIVYVESLKDYTRVHMLNDNLVVKGNIGSILSKLPEKTFIRVHRSFVVAIPHIKSFNQSHIEILDTKLPIGSSYKEELKGKLF
ncbi:MAG: LytTR family DNA-binding domain-containing protein [Bacteroidota bacterium]